MFESLKKSLKPTSKLEGRVENFYILGLPIWKVKYLTHRLKVYFCGIQLFSFNVRQELLENKVTLVKDDKYLETQLLQLRALDVIMKNNNRDIFGGEN